MKKLFYSCSIIICALLLPKQFLAQDITGVWKGAIFNDTTQLYYPYEIAISEEKGKLIGYSQTIYSDNGKDEMGLKSVRIKKKGPKIIIEDVELIANTYSMPPPKGVRKLMILELTINDTVMVLAGPWSTNRTRVYAPGTGSVSIQRKNNYKASSSALLQLLDELKLTKDLSFVEENKPVELPPVVKADPDKKPNPEPVKKKEPKPEIVKAPKKEKEKPAKVDKPKEVAVIVAEKKPVVVETPKPVVVEAPKPIPPAAEIAKRKISSTQSVFFESDSLVFTLYDNGDVDGDTVSVMMNGTLLFSKQGLTTKANSKTIHIDHTTADSLLLVMYAENLGDIPPNTGLLVVRDGDKIYDVRFSADLQSNAAIILRRKRKTP